MSALSLRVGRGSLCLLVVSFLSAAAGLAREKPLEIRLSPAPPFDAAPSRLSLPLGFLEGPSNPFLAERVTSEPPAPDAGVALAPDGCTFTNGTDSAKGLAWVTRPLRAGTGFVVRVRGRLLSGSGRLLFTAEPLNTDDERLRHIGKMSLESGEEAEKAFEIVPLRAVPYRIRLAAAPGASVRVGTPSCVPAHSVGPWDGFALDALRSLQPEEVRWPVADGLVSYNFYDGIGPLSLRRRANPLGDPAGGHPFGTVEAAEFCRALGVPLRLRVYASTNLTEDVSRAADWVAFCNAEGDSPMATLRSRYGHPAALNIDRWEIVSPAPGLAAPFKAAMMRQDDSIDVCAACPELALSADRYVAGLFQRFTPADASYYEEWYGALELAYAYLAAPPRASADGRLYVPWTAERLLSRQGLTAPGLVVALLNRDPPVRPVKAEIVGAAAGNGSPLAVRAAWTERDELELLLYNSMPEREQVLVNLEAMREPFMFWVSEQLAGQVDAPRNSSELPVNILTRAGAALRQVFYLTLEPSSVTKVNVRKKK
jgi:hypothetical protein